MQNQDTTPLPAGIWFEPDRNRYRIRLYHRRKVIYLDYCTCREAALVSLAIGRQRRAQARMKQPPRADISTPGALLLSSLAFSS